MMYTDNTVRRFRVTVRSIASPNRETIKDYIQEKLEVLNVETTVTVVHDITVRSMILVTDETIRRILGEHVEVLAVEQVSAEVNLIAR